MRGYSFMSNTNKHELGYCKKNLLSYCGDWFGILPPIGESVIVSESEEMLYRRI